MSKKKADLSQIGSLHDIVASYDEQLKKQMAENPKQHPVAFFEQLAEHIAEEAVERKIESLSVHKSAVNVVKYAYIIVKLREKQIEIIEE